MAQINMTKYFAIGLVLIFISAFFVPDYSYDIFSMVIILGITPITIALISGQAGLIKRKKLWAVFYLLFALGFHRLISWIIYYKKAGYEAVHDGLTIPIFWGTTAIQTVLALIVFTTYVMIKSKKNR